MTSQTFVARIVLSFASSLLNMFQTPTQRWKSGPSRAASSDLKIMGLQPLWLASAEIG